MTLNGYYALMSVLESTFHGFASSGFRIKMFGNLHIIGLLSASKNCSPMQRLVSGDV